MPLYRVMNGFKKALNRGGSKFIGDSLRIFSGFLQNRSGKRKKGDSLRRTMLLFMTGNKIFDTIKIIR